MFCPKCGNSIITNQSFCPYCGSALQSPADDEPTQSGYQPPITQMPAPEKQNKKAVKTAVIIACVAVLLTGCIIGAVVLAKNFGYQRTGAAEQGTAATAQTAGETASAVTSETELNDAYLKDDADLLSAKEKGELIRRLHEVRQEHRFDVVIHTTDTYDGKSAMAYADDYYDDNGYGYGENRDGCILVINMTERDWYLSTCGTGITALDDEDLSGIGEAITPYLKDGDYYQAFQTYIDIVEQNL